MTTALTNDNFRLRFGFEEDGVTIDLNVLGEVLNTRQIPNIYPLLFTILPSILRNRCFNDENLPFCEEVGRTELGHLFEHILLEYMCILKSRKTKNVSFSGKTYWEKSEAPAKNFTIKISCSLSDIPFFLKSLDQSVKAMNLILSGGSYNLPYATPSQREFSNRSMSHRYQ